MEPRSQAIPSAGTQLRTFFLGILFAPDGPEGPEAPSLGAKEYGGALDVL
jgi:hypothetical protein